MTTPTPCVGVCSTAQGDKICRGCCRFDYEVNNWVNYSEEERASVEADLCNTLEQAVSKYVTISNEEKLDNILSQLPHRFSYRSKLCRSYYMLCSVFSPKMAPLGLKCETNLTTKQSRGLINNEWRRLRMLHYDK
jgi:predicted Fe-S protein YdhL (DUF1289 family)